MTHYSAGGLTETQGKIGGARKASKGTRPDITLLFNLQALEEIVYSLPMTFPLLRIISNLPISPKHVERLTKK